MLQCAGKKGRDLSLKFWFDLLWTFFKVGICTFGGGYAMLPVLEREVVDKKHWATEEEILDYYAVGQCTPGIIALNTSTFIGYKYKGVWGGIACSLGFVLPSWIIITVIAALLTGFADSPYVINALAGIRICVCVLIANSVKKLWKSSIVDKTTLVIYILVLGTLLAFKYLAGVSLTPVIFVILAGIAGIALKVWGVAKK